MPDVGDGEFAPTKTLHVAGGRAPKSSHTVNSKHKIERSRCSMNLRVRPGRYSVNPYQSQEDLDGDECNVTLTSEQDHPLGTWARSLWD